MDMRVEGKPAFTIIGRKTWIGGQNNEEFGQFWTEAETNGLLTLLGSIRGPESCPVTGAEYLGLSGGERPNGQTVRLLHRRGERGAGGHVRSGTDP